MKWKVFGLILCAAMILSLFAACANSPAPMDNAGNSQNAMKRMDPAATPSLSDIDEESGESTGDGFSAPAEAEPSEQNELNILADPNRKRIRMGNLLVESTSFDASLSKLRTLVGTFGGYEDSSQIPGVSQFDAYSKTMRTATLTVRVPAENFDKFLDCAGDLGNVLERETSSEDVTDQYFDTEAHVAMLKMELEMLKTEFEKSTKMEDSIKLLDRITGVQYEIEKLTGTLKKYDGLVKYSTIHVVIREVLAVTPAEHPTVPPKTFGERLSNAFTDAVVRVKEGGASFLVFLAGAAPSILIWGIVIFLVVWLIRKIVQKSRRRVKKPSAAGGTAELNTPPWSPNESPNPDEPPHEDNDDK